MKLQHNTLLVEYNMLRESISGSRQLQAQSDNIALAVLGISIPILLIPIHFFAIAFTQLLYERILMVAELYIDTVLRPSIDILVTFASPEKVHLLQWEGYLSRRS